MDDIDLARALRGSIGGGTARRGSSSPTTTTTILGTATGDSADGVAPVRIDGNGTGTGDDGSTEMSSTVNVREGDQVMISLVGADGTAKHPIVTGVVGRGDEQQVEIDRAKKAADDAEQYAGEAQESAGIARESATAAGNYAATALAGLSTVQSVGETLAWVAQHGQMVSTTDTSIDPTKVYFVQDPNGEYTVSGVRYSIVKAPKASDLGTYYELKMLDSVQNYLTTHLAVTDDGLHVFGKNGRVIVGESAGFHVTISPDKLAFCQGQRSDGHGGFEDNEIAWVSNNELHVPKAVITDGLQVGHWRWTELSNGNFALKYIA